jgi:[acyl-carrier-protein] S-malonyltransferase
MVNTVEGGPIMKALVFAGQGSQYVGMMSDLIEQFPEARAVAERANQVVGYDLINICVQGPADTLKETRYTQPALFVHEAMVLELTMIHRSAAAVAGHSLGEYSALYAAGVLSFEDALRAVALRGDLMFKTGLAIPGTMAAIVGLSDDAVREVCSKLDNADGQRLVAANFNAPGQVVISGSAEYVRSMLPAFKAAGAKLVKELSVSGAFHSPLLQDAQRPLSEALEQLEFKDAAMDVYVNVSGEPLRRGDDLRRAAQEQLTAPVQWTTTIQNIVRAGVTAITEVGPGSVLQGLVKRIAPEVTTNGLDTAQHVQSYREQTS